MKSNPSLKVLTLSILSGAALLSLAGMSEARGPGGMERPAFTEIDANGDGAVTREEIAAHIAGRGAARFEQADTDGDGALSRDEMVAAARSGADDRAGQRFDRLDADGDGSVTKAEMDAARETARAQGGKKGGRHGGGENRFERMFERADADSNGSLSAEEWDAMASRRGNR